MPAVHGDRASGARLDSATVGAGKRTDVDDDVAPTTIATTSSEADSATRSIGRKTRRGLWWSLLGTVGAKISWFAMGLVLARLLTPADFGMYAIAMAATAFVMHINNVGLVAATVQWRGRLEEMAPTATTLAVVFSSGIYAIFWFAAPSFAQLSGSPEAAGVIRLLTAVIIIDGITAVRAGALERNFQQNKLIQANLVGGLIGAAVAIPLAAGGAGPYSFAAGHVACVMVTGVLVFTWAKVPVKFGLDPVIARRLMRFGLPLAASLGVEAILMNVDFVIIGRIMGAAPLGFYLLAFNVSSWAQGIVSTAVRYVSVASFSRLAEANHKAWSAGAQRSIPLLVTSVLPIAMLMAVLAPALVVFFYGEQWAPAAAVLRFLAVLTVVRALVAFAIDILTSIGATRTSMWLNLGWALALVPALIVGTRLDGIRGAAIAHGVVAMLVAIPLAMLALHRCGVRLAPIGPALVRPLVAVALAALSCLLTAEITQISSFIDLFAAGSTGLLVYVAVVLPREQWRRLGKQVRALMSARRSRSTPPTTG